MEVEIIKPMWFEGQPLSPGEDGQPNPVVDMSVSDATYLQGIGRVRAIVAEIPPGVAEGVADADTASVSPADAAVGDAVAVADVVADVVSVAPADASPVPAKSKKS